MIRFWVLKSYRLRFHISSTKKPNQTRTKTWHQNMPYYGKSPQSQTLWALVSSSTKWGYFWLPQRIVEDNRRQCTYVYKCILRLLLFRDCLIVFHVIFQWMFIMNLWGRIVEVINGELVLFILKHRKFKFYHGHIIPNLSRCKSEAPC